MLVDLRNPRLLLVAIGALALALRVASVALSDSWVATDTQHYIRLAGGIVEGTPTSERSNGYPLLIAGLSYLMPGAYITLALVSLNVVFSVLVVVLAAGLGRSVAGWGAGLLAALGTALYPHQINYVRYLLTEAPTAFVLTASVYLLVRHRENGWALVGAGALLGIGVLLRSSLLAVFVALLVACLWAGFGKRVIPVVVGGLLVAALNMALLSGGVIAPPRHTGHNLLLAVQENSSEGISYTLEDFSAEERSRPLATYLRFAAEEPATFVRQRVASLWELWGPWPAAGDPENPRGLVTRLLIGLRFLILMLAAGGLARYARRRDVWIIAAPIFAITAVHVMFFSVPRFGYVVEPVLLVLAACFVADRLARSGASLKEVSVVPAPE